MGASTARTWPVAANPGYIKLICILTSSTLSEWRRHTTKACMVLRPVPPRIGSRGIPGAPGGRIKGLWGNRSPLATVFKAIEASVIFGPGVIISGMLLKQTAAKILGKPGSASLCLFEEIPPERRPCAANQAQPLPNRSPVLIGAQEPRRWQRQRGPRAATGISPGDATSSRIRRFLVIIKPVMTRAESGAGERLAKNAVS